VLAGVVESMRDPEHFAQVRLDPEIGTITWPSGADLAPEVRYESAGPSGGRLPSSGRLKGSPGDRRLSCDLISIGCCCSRPPAGPIAAPGAARRTSGLAASGQIQDGPSLIALTYYLAVERPR
jgi:hypothetical protein